MPLTPPALLSPRLPRVLGLAAAALLSASSGVARAAEPCSSVAPWSRLSESGRHFARPVPLTLTALAVVTPFAMIPTGLDQQVRLLAQRDSFGKPRLEPVSVWTPYVLAGGLLVGYGVAVLADSCSAKRRLSPVLQAGVLTFGTVAILKFGVGRQWPNGGRNPEARDRLDHPEYARDFTPFQRPYAAWPSGHTALMFAAASAFRAGNPDLGLAAWLGYPLAVGVASGMWLGDHHWGSDIISGALLGEAIGSSVGQSFSEALGVPGALVLSAPGNAGIGVQWLTLW
ncbi:MAG: phosphatase PAP2 family protein [Polyangiaceae bacterium]